MTQPKAFQTYQSFLKGCSLTILLRIFQSLTILSRRHDASKSQTDVHNLPSAIEKFPKAIVKRSIAKCVLWIAIHLSLSGAITLSLFFF